MLTMSTGYPQPIDQTPASTNPATAWTAGAPWHRGGRGRRRARHRPAGGQSRFHAGFLGDAAAGGFTPSTTLKLRFEPADDRTAELLGIEPGTEVTVRDRVMRADGLAVMLAVSRLPRSITRGTLIEEVNTGPGGAYARLEGAGFEFAPFQELVKTRMPTPEESTALQLAEGTPVLVVTRVATATDGTVLEVNDMVLAGDRYELVYEIPAE